MSVRGRTLAEAERILGSAAQIAPDARVLVALRNRRAYGVLVVRRKTSRDAAVDQLAAGPEPDVARRSVGQVVELPAYENDVLRASAVAGELPDWTRRTLST